MNRQAYSAGWLPDPASSPDEQMLQDICENRRRAFLDACIDDVPLPMTYTEPQQNPAKIMVWHHPKAGMMHRGAVIALRGFPMEHAVVVIHDHYDDFFSPSLWVNQKSKRYREAYALFLAEFHGYKGSLTIAKLGYDVDHLRSYSRTPAGTYIRVEACPKRSNRHWGSTYESASTKDFFKPYKPRGTADFMTVAKLSGVLPPKDWQDKVGIQRMTDLSNHMWPDDDKGLIKHLLVEDLMRAYLPRKKKKELLMTMKAQHHRNPLSEHIVPWSD